MLSNTGSGDKTINFPLIGSKKIYALPYIIKACWAAGKIDITNLVAVRILSGIKHEFSTIEICSRIKLKMASLPFRSWQ